MRRHPGIAAVLSFVVPGLGQIYNGELKKGFSFVAGLIFSGLLTVIHIGFVFFIVLWIRAVFDAYNTAEKRL